MPEKGEYTVSFSQFFLNHYITIILPKNSNCHRNKIQIQLYNTLPIDNDVNLELNLYHNKHT